MSETTTIRDLFYRALGMTGEIIPGASMLVPMLRPQLEGVLGQRIDLDSVLWTDQSRYGVTARRFSDSLNNIGAAVGADIVAGSRAQDFRGLFRSMYSLDQYNKDVQEGRISGYSAGQEGYDLYTAVQASSAETNPLLGAAYKLLKATDISAINEGITGAVRNMTYPNYLKGQSDAGIVARRIASGIFNDVNGNYIFNQADYSGFNEASVAGLMSELTKSGDFAAGASTAAPSTIKERTETLRKRLQDTARALEPLKDVFGNDIPAMLKSIESISDMSVNTMTSEKLGAAAARIATGVSTGTYAIEDVLNTSNMVSSQMRQLGLSPVQMRYADNTAVRVLEATRTLDAPSYMTKTDWANMTTKDIIGTANSDVANLYNKAYGIWRQKERAAGRDATADEFREFVAASGDIVGVTRALGLSSVNELNTGAAYSGFSIAAESGLGAELALKADVDNRWKGVTDQVVWSNGLTRALAETNGGVRDPNRTRAMMGLLKSVALTDEGNKIINMSDSERESYIKDHSNLAKLGIGEKDATDLVTTITYLRNTDPAAIGMLQEVKALGDADKKNREMEERRKALEKFDYTRGDSLKGFLEEVVTNSGKGYQAGDFEKRALQDREMFVLAGNAKEDYGALMTMSKTLIESDVNRKRRELVGDRFWEVLPATEQLEITHTLNTQAKASAAEYQSVALWAASDQAAMNDELVISTMKKISDITTDNGLTTEGREKAYRKQLDRLQMLKDIGGSEMLKTYITDPDSPLSDEDRKRYGVDKDRIPGADEMERINTYRKERDLDALVKLWETEGEPGVRREVTRQSLMRNIGKVTVNGKFLTESQKQTTSDIAKQFFESEDLQWDAYGRITAESANKIIKSGDLRVSTGNGITRVASGEEIAVFQEHLKRNGIITEQSAGGGGLPADIIAAIKDMSNGVLSLVQTVPEAAKAFYDAKASDKNVQVQGAGGVE